MPGWTESNDHKAVSLSLEDFANYMVLTNS